MPLQSFSDDFMDWVCARMVEWSEGYLSAGVSLFDERQKGMASLIREALSSKLQYCAGVSLASTKRVRGAGSADDTVHRISVHVAVLRGSLCTALSLRECAWLAETLYVAFCGAGYLPTPGSGRPDVFADEFSAQVNEKGGAMFTFTVSIERDIDKINNSLTYN